MKKRKKSIAEIVSKTRTITSSSKTIKYHSLNDFHNEDYNIEKLPFTIRILLENVIRNYNGFNVTEEHLQTILNWKPKPQAKEIPYLPARVLMQDFTGVPSVVDIASIRSEVERKGKNSDKINPQIPVDLIIDHSVQVDYFGTDYSYEKNVEMEYKRNRERYSLLKWADSSFKNFKVLPPGMGICHQVNLEYLANVVTIKNGTAFPDTLVGTDSHTPMVNGIGVVGWGVGGIEAEAAMLGQPIYIMLPEVIGLRLSGKLKEGTTSTDLVLSIAELLRKEGVVGKFVEVFGDGLDNLTVPDRATISNMSPEFGCTVTYFPPDKKTLEYLEVTGRSEQHISTVEKYLKANLLWRKNEDKIKYTKIVKLNLNNIQPSIAGPKRPQDKIRLSDAKDKFIDVLKESYEREYLTLEERAEQRWLNEGGQIWDSVDYPDKKMLEKIGAEIKARQKKNGLKSVSIKVDNSEFLLSDGSIVIAAITSCTNTSNPSVMIGAGLAAKKAVEKGLTTKPWVKTSLAPGSKVVTKYLEKAQLKPFLESLGFHLVGYGCTTCIGNSGQLPPHISKAVIKNNLVTASILSGNRNFEARIHPLIKMNFLTSPMLVVAFAIAGRIDIDLEKEPLGFDPNFKPVYLKDILPAQEEIQSVMNQVLDSKDYKKNYASVFKGDEHWASLKDSKSEIYNWSKNSTYIKETPFFKNISEQPEEISNINSASVLLKLGDSVTTDHVSPAGAIAEDSPAGIYLKKNGIKKADFNSYGSRRGNHEVMVRGTFANVRLKNLLVDKEGGWTIYHPDGKTMTIFDAAMKYKKDNTPLIILAGKEYGSGSSRDWAAKGVSLLGVKAIIAESFERIHRSNLVGMGVLPLKFEDDQNCNTLSLTGDEDYTIVGLEEDLVPNKKLKVTVNKKGKIKKEFNVIARLDSKIEIEYYKNGGILQYVLREFLKKK
ncbi:MAG: aconitate hydratase AcnA [Ignavibacteriae bacterium]|nr:aconitate hydratase AcnA [Ignavibacteriota bacterium]NOG98581.1 aconitate hydratase AcnA [Ignavibacteriota bacterium]